MGKILMRAIDTIIGLLIILALITWGTVFWFDFNIIEFITFGINWLAGIIYTIVAIMGSVWLISAIIRLAMKGSR